MALYAEVDISKTAASELLSRVNDLPPGSGTPHWAAFATWASAGVSALEHVVQHQSACRRPEGARSSCCSFFTKINNGQHVMSHRAIVEIIMTSQRVSRKHPKPQRTDEFLRGSFPANDPCHKKWENEHPFPKRRGIAYPETIFFWGVNILIQRPHCISCW